MIGLERVVACRLAYDSNERVACVGGVSQPLAAFAGIRCGVIRSTARVETGPKGQDPLLPLLRERREMNVQGRSRRELHAARWGRFYVFRHRPVSSILV